MRRPNYTLSPDTERIVREFLTVYTDWLQLEDRVFDTDTIVNNFMVGEEIL